MWLLLACTQKSPDDTVDPGETADSADTDAPEDVLEAVATPSPDMPTVVRVAWSYDGGGEGWVEYQREGGALTRVDAITDGATEYEALLFGLAPEGVYTWSAGVSGPTEVRSPAQVLTIAERPRDLPDLTTFIDEPSVAEGYFAVGMVSVSSLAAILDSDGAYVWWFSIPDELNYVSRVLRSVDGRTVLLNSAPSNTGDPEGAHRIYRVSYDGAEVEPIEVPFAHHDYCELPDGSLAFIAYDYRTLGDEEIEGDKLVERAPDGTLRNVWSAWDWFDYADYADTAAGTEFVHANSVQYDAGSDSYVIGLRNTNGLVRVDRQSGALLERIGGDGSDYELVTGTPTQGQHSFTLLPEGFVVHDNRTDTPDASRVVEYLLSGPPGEGIMEEVWTYENPDGYREFGLGDAVRLPNGNTRIVWSSSGELNEISPAGERLWKVNLDVGTGFGYGSFSEDPQIWP